MDLRGETVGLKLIKVNKTELIETLKKNKKTHIIEYDESYKGFVIESTQRLKKALKDAKSEKFDDVYFSQPDSHESDYSVIIEMLEMSVDTEVEISAEQFRRYVRDEWSWTSSFKEDFVKYSQLK